MSKINKCVVVTVSLPIDTVAQLKTESKRVGLSLSRLVSIYCKSRLGATIMNGEITE
jgi:hypothetical protein